MKQITKGLSVKFSTFLVLTVLFIGSSFSQTISGPTTVASGSTHTYSYTDGLLHPNKSWSITGESETSSWYTKRPLTMYVTVQWGTGSSGQVMLNSNGATLNVTITGGSGSNPPANTNLSNENYVHTLVPRIATTNTTTLANDEKIESITYFDGLGRAKQSNAIRAGGDSEDIVTHITYDQYGRVNKGYLPFAQTNNGGALVSNAENLTNTFYTAKYSNDIGTVPNPFSEKEFEASPLNRVLKQAAPGNDWALGSGHEIELGYQTNSNSEVRRYTVSLAYSNNKFTPILGNSSGFYNAGELYKSITKDENHTSGSNNHTTEEFKDAEGRVILKRTYNNAPHDTYYIYDDYGNLTYVLPPKVLHDASISSAELNELSYQYIYDHRNRLIEKKIPGKGWEYIIYNRLDQPIMTQDANLRLSNKWLFTKYDAFGRVVYTGDIITAASKTQIQTAANNVNQPQYETKGPDINHGGTILDYTNDAYPQWATEVLTINYYDDYNFDKAGGNSETAYGITPEINVKSLATGSKVRVLGTNDWITSVTYYDDKARPIYIYSKNTYLDTVDKIKSELTFDSTVTETTTTHSRTGFSTITTVDSFTYDHMNRLIDQQQTINNSTAEVIVENNYDELGQLESKGVGGSGSSRLQTVDYKYNIRGWLKQINDVANLGNDLFSFKINYNTADHGANTLFNGNISETEWKTANTDNSLKWYKYDYDPLNRITNGTDNTGKFNLSSISYDKNGNITALQRQGAIVSQPVLSNNSHFGQMDNLIYTYQGNQLKKVVDNLSNDQFGFKDDAVNNTSDASDDYTYDANGNLLSDANKSITAIQYNHLNLPTDVLFGNTNTQEINYVYSANGVKLRKSVNDNGSITTTDYASGFIYENNTLKFFSHAEGYVEPDGINGFNYVYSYLDHLGNIRLNYSDLNGNGTIETASEILEENSYYPFGLKMRGFNNVINGTDHKYGFGGKEEQDELGLGWMDITARNYDAALGRWMNVDAFADAAGQIHNSPYAYGMNNPIVFNDPDGNCPPGVDCWSILKGAGSAVGDALVGLGKMSTPYMIYDAATGGYQEKLATGKFVRENPGLVFDASVNAVSEKWNSGTEGKSYIITSAALVFVDPTPAGELSGVKKIADNALDLATDVATKASDDLLQGGTRLSDDMLSAAPSKSGNAPIGKDGHPVELHHRDQTTNGPLDEMTRTDHRLGENYKKNHSNTGQAMSRIDRKKFNAQRRAHWAKELQSGRFDNIKKTITPYSKLKL